MDQHPPHPTAAAGETTPASAGPSPRAQPVLWLALLLLAGLGWAITALQAGDMRSMTQMPEMGMAPAPAPVFLAVWISMMVAMMFPSVAPVASLFTTMSRARRRTGAPVAPTWALLAGYLAVWTLFGVGAYLLSLAVPAVGMRAPGLRAYSPVAAGVVLIAAGLYQWSPLKNLCLRHCRSPLAIIVHGWRDGYLGALRMGIVHGAYCVGCCWGFMVILFAVGLMNLGWMILLTGLIFAEKVVPRGVLIGKAAGVVLVLLGVGALVAPLLGRLPGPHPV